MTFATDGSIIWSMETISAQMASAMTTPLTGKAFDEKFASGWTMDEKLDGHRVIIEKHGAKVNAYGPSRNGKESKPKELPIHLLMDAGLLPDGIYDGELVVVGGNSWDVSATINLNDLKFYAFDVLALLGHKTMHLTQAQRREMLELAIKTAYSTPVDKTGGIVLVPTLAPTWANVQRIWKRGGEGAILKRLDATYKPGHRTDAWIKVKKLHHVVGVITGFEAGSFGPYAVTKLKLEKNGHDARVKTLNTETLLDIEKNPSAWIGRRLVIQCQQLTPSGSPRHPMWDHVAGPSE